MKICKKKTILLSGQDQHCRNENSNRCVKIVSLYKECSMADNVHQDDGGNIGYKVPDYIPFHHNHYPGKVGFSYLFRNTLFYYL